MSRILFLCSLFLFVGLPVSSLRAQTTDSEVGDVGEDTGIEESRTTNTEIEATKVEGAVQGSEGPAAPTEKEEDATSKDPLADVTEGAEEGEAFDVEWYRPETMKGKVEKKSWVQISLTGKTLPGARVTVSQRSVPVIIPGKKGKKSKITKISRKKIMKGKRYFQANTDGLFNMELYLPVYSIQLPVTVMPPKKIGMQKQEFVIVMKPSKQSVILETEKVLSASPLTRKANALRLSLGIFGLIGQQTSAILGQDLGIGIGALVYRLDWSRWIKERWKFEIHLSSDSGSGNTFQGDEITLSSSDFVRQEYQFKGIHFPQLWKYKLLKKYDSEWGYFLGVNYQTFPYLNRQAGESSTVTAQLKTNAVTTVFTGLQYMVDINSKWSSEFQMLYYHPLSVTGGVTSLESSMMLGFVGDVSYSISPRFKVGGRFGYYLDQQTSSYYDEVSADSASIVEVRNRTDASIFGTWLF